MIMQNDDKKLLEELKGALVIDKNDLDEELTRFSEIFHEVSERLVLLISERDAAKKDLSEIEAVVDAELRNEAYKADVKTTEREIESNKKLDKRVKRAHDQVLYLSLLVGKFAALKESLDKKSYMLRALCDLFSSNYFSRDIHSKGAQQVRQEAGREAKQLIQRERVKMENK